MDKNYIYNNENTMYHVNISNNILTITDSNNEIIKGNIKERLSS